MPIFMAVPGSHLKHKRNVKTRQQYKKKAQAQRVTIQKEMEHLDVQSSGEAAVKCTRFGAAFPAGKHVFLQSLDVATSPQHAAVISCVGMALFDEMILVQNGAICRPRMGVG